MNKDTITGVVAVHETVSVFHVKPFYGFDHSLILVTAYAKKTIQDVIQFAPLQLSVQFSSPGADDLNSKPEFLLFSKPESGASEGGQLLLTPLQLLFEYTDALRETRNMHRDLPYAVIF